VIEGFVTSAIIKALSEKAADLLIMGTEGVHQGLNHLLLGSNTEALMLGAGCLTLTVGPYVPENIAQKLEFRRVIYVSDFSVASTAAATYASALARSFGVDTEIYQLASKAAQKDLSRLKKTAAQYCDMLHFSNPDLPEAWFNPEYQLARIVPEADLLAAVSEPSDLIVLGIHPASFLQRHLQSSLAYRLLVSAASPVLTVPADFPLKRVEKAN